MPRALVPSSPPQPLHAGAVQQSGHRSTAMRTCIILLLVAAFSTLAAAQPDEPGWAEAMQDSTRIRSLGQAFIMYSRDHNGELPPDLAPTLDYISPNDPNPAQRIRNFA